MNSVVVYTTNRPKHNIWLSSQHDKLVENVLSGLFPPSAPRPGQDIVPGISRRICSQRSGRVDPKCFTSFLTREDLYKTEKCFARNILISLQGLDFVNGACRGVYSGEVSHKSNVINSFWWVSNIEPSGEPAADPLRVGDLHLLLPQLHGQLGGRAEGGAGRHRVLQWRHLHRPVGGRPQARPGAHRLDHGQDLQVTGHSGKSGRLAIKFPGCLPKKRNMLKCSYLSLETLNKKVEVWPTQFNFTFL